RVLVSGGERRLEPEVTGEGQVLDPRVGGGQLADERERLVATAVIDEHQLQVVPAELGDDFRIRRHDAVCLVVARNHGSEAEFSFFIGCHVYHREAPVSSSSGSIGAIQCSPSAPMNQSIVASSPTGNGTSPAGSIPTESSVLASALTTAPACSPGRIGRSTMG